MKTWALLPAAAALALGCSSSNSGTGTGTNPFVGSWSCSNQIADTYTQPAALGTQPKMTTSTITLVDAGNGNVSASGSNDGGKACMLTFSTQGSMATIANGQTCTINGILSTFTMGTYTVSGNTLTGSFQASFSGTVTIGNKPVTATGTENASSTCTRSS